MSAAVTVHFKEGSSGYRNVNE